MVFAHAFLADAVSASSIRQELAFRVDRRTPVSVHARRDYAVPEHADMLHLGFHDIAGMQEFGRRAGEPDTVGRAGGDDRSWQKGHAFRHPLDDRVDRVDHVASVPVLLGNAVDTELQTHRLRIRQLVRGHDPRTGRAAPIEALALEVLTTPAALDVARSHVVERHVAEHVAPGRGAIDVGSCLPDDDRELNLPVDLVADSGIDGDVAEWLRERGDGLGEDGRRTGLATLQSGCLGRVLLVVATDGDRVAAWLRQWWQQLDCIDRVLSAAAIACRFTDRFQARVARIDERQHVSRFGYLDQRRAVGPNDTETRTAVGAKCHELHLSWFSSSSGSRSWWAGVWPAPR